MQGQGVYTIAFTSRCRTIVENVAKMCATDVADDFEPIHSKAGIVFVFDILFINGMVEAGPAGIGMEFGIGIKQRSIANDTVIHALVKIIGVFAAKWRLGTFQETNIILLFC